MSDAGFTKDMSQAECREWLGRAREVEGFAEHTDAKWHWDYQITGAQIPPLEGRRIEKGLSIVLARASTWTEFESYFWPLATRGGNETFVNLKVQQTRSKKLASPDHCDLALHTSSLRQSVGLAIFNHRLSRDRVTLLSLLRRAVTVMECDRDIEITDEGRVRLLTDRFVDSALLTVQKRKVWSRLLNLLRRKSSAPAPTRPTVGYSPLSGGPIYSLDLSGLQPNETLSLGKALTEGFDSEAEGNSYPECFVRLPLSELGSVREHLTPLGGPWTVKFLESGTESLDELLHLPASGENRTYWRSAFSIRNPDVGVIGADLAFDGESYKFQFSQRGEEEEQHRGWKRLQKQLAKG